MSGPRTPGRSGPTIYSCNPSTRPWNWCRRHPRNGPRNQSTPSSLNWCDPTPESSACSTGSAPATPIPRTLSLILLYHVCVFLCADGTYLCEDPDLVFPYNRYNRFHQLSFTICNNHLFILSKIICKIKKCGNGNYQISKKTTYFFIKTPKFL